MSIEIIVALISVGVAISNSFATGMLYLSHLRNIKNTIVSVTADEDGEIRILNPFDR